LTEFIFTNKKGTIKL